ncbi:MAG: prepilin-type N-terminal cleavage/methylation domain-containing protein [Bdellovibrionota bacterium]|nr:prepilin-type N-terminal cleavage/methylation domain-containing protein [Bdellovibrionota bacterium]
MVLKVEKISIKISQAKTFNFILLKKTAQKGFSLLEILIAVALVALVTAIAVQSFSTNDHQDLEDTVFEIDRSLRYATNEAIMRNSIVRLRIDLDTSPIEYIIEYGEGSEMVLPEMVDSDKLSIKEREDEANRQKKLDGRFTNTGYFEDGPKKFKDTVLIYGVGTSYQENIVTSGQASIYFYPSGEKDSAIIFLNTDEELVSLKIPPFEEKLYDEYYKFSQTEMDYIDDTLEGRSREVFRQWLRE